jgi:small-conductance mechanosensitive channel/CRP-like cAMP-binding protein
VEEHDSPLRKVRREPALGRLIAALAALAALASHAFAADGPLGPTATAAALERALASAEKSFFRAVVAETLEDRTLWIGAGILGALALVRAAAPAGRRSLSGVVALFFLHLIFIPIAAAFRGDASTYAEVRLPCWIFGGMAAIGATSAVTFDVALQLVKIDVPRILRDVIAAIAAALLVFGMASRLGFNLSGIITTSAVLTAVIGFSLQDTLGNIMGGLALQMDNSVKVGDWIKVNDPNASINGRVVEIRWRYTAVETRNWETLIVPNSILMKNQVLVLGRRTARPVQWRRWVWFNVDFRYEPTDVIQAVNEALQAAPIEHVSADPAPHAILMDLSESYGRYAARYWLTDLAVDDPTDSQVRTRIYFALKRAGIPLSMPAHAIFVTEDSSERRAQKSRSERERRLRALGQIDLFAHLAAEDRQALADSLRYAPFARGETLTRQGAEAHWLYMIIDGEASVRVTVPGAPEREVARLRAGQFFGEMALLTGEPRSATVVALTDVECYRLDKASFQEILKKRPEAAEKVAAILAARRVELDAVRENLGEEAKRRRLEATQTHLLDKIRDFFGLANETAGVR